MILNWKQVLRPCYKNRGFFQEYLRLRDYYFLDLHEYEKIDNSNSSFSCYTGGI